MFWARYLYIFYVLILYTNTLYLNDCACARLDETSEDQEDLEGDHQSSITYKALFQLSPAPKPRYAAKQFLVKPYLILHPGSYLLMAAITSVWYLVWFQTLNERYSLGVSLVFGFVPIYLDAVFLNGYILQAYNGYGVNQLYLLLLFYIWYRRVVSKAFDSRLELLLTYLTPSSIPEASAILGRLKRSYRQQKRQPLFLVSNNQMQALYQICERIPSLDFVKQILTVYRNQKQGARKSRYNYSQVLAAVNHLLNECSNIRPNVTSNNQMLNVLFQEFMHYLVTIPLRPYRNLYLSLLNKAQELKAAPNLKLPQRLEEFTAILETFRQDCIVEALQYVNQTTSGKWNLEGKSKKKIRKIMTQASRSNSVSYHMNWFRKLVVHHTYQNSNDSLPEKLLTLFRDQWTWEALQSLSEHVAICQSLIATYLDPSSREELTTQPTFKKALERVSELCNTSLNDTELRESITVFKANPSIQDCEVHLKDLAVAIRTMQQRCYTEIRSRYLPGAQTPNENDRVVYDIIV